MAVASKESLIGRISKLSLSDREVVTNVLDGLEGKKKKYFHPDYLGMLSLRLVDWFGPKSNLTDDEVDEIIASVRAEERANSN